MILMVWAARNSAKSASTPMTMRPSTAVSSYSLTRAVAPADLHDLHARARLDDLVVVVGPRGPHLALELHAAAVARRRARRTVAVLADERRGAGAQLRPGAAGGGGRSGAAPSERDGRDDEEDEARDDERRAGGADDARRRARRWRTGARKKPSVRISPTAKTTATIEPDHPLVHVRR